jgi:RHS repeat-associated protein
MLGLRHWTCLGLVVALLLPGLVSASNNGFQVNYCGQRSLLQPTNQCFDTFEEAEEFIKEEPVPPRGRALLEKLWAPPLGLGNVPGRIRVRYAVPAKAHEGVAAIQLMAIHVGGGWQRDCPGQGLHKIYDMGCRSEEQLAADIINGYPHNGNGSLAFLGDYDPLPPVAWDAVTPRTVTGFKYVHVRRNTGPDKRRVVVDRHHYRIWTASFYYQCPVLYSGTSQGSLPPPYWPVVCRNASVGDITIDSTQFETCDTRGNPCVPATGAKEYSHTDLEWEGGAFTRRYNSIGELPLASFMGEHWAHPYSHRLVLPQSGTMVHWINEKGYFEAFRRIDSTRYASMNRVGHVLHSVAADMEADGSRWKLAAVDGRVLHFDGAGRLLRIDLDDRRLVLDYCTGEQFSAGICEAEGALRSVTSSSGRQLRFGYERLSAEIPGFPGYEATPVRLVKVEAAGGPQVRYGYDVHGMLSSADYLGSGPAFKRQYLYGEAERVCRTPDGNTPLRCSAALVASRLTGVIDEGAGRLATYQYDERGRVVSSEHAGGAGRVTLRYEANRTVRVTDVDGGVSVFQFDNTRLRKPLLVRRETADGSVSLDTNRTFDALHRNTSRTDPTGTRTNYGYDAFHQTSVTEGLTASGQPTDVTRTTTSQWDADLNRLLSRTEGETRVDFTYNPRGQPLTRSETSLLSGEVRTTIYHYCEADDLDDPAASCPRVGLLKSIDGPRTDIADTTTYTYYTADAAGCDTSPATCAHRRGDLRTVTNALGHVSETLRYDGAGRPLSMRDANGVVTDLEYHPRGWLTRRIVRGANAGADAITRIDYLPTGLVSRVTQPDGSFVRYEYDAAHRLTAVIDALDNRIDYTLDAAGNRTHEQVRGSDGALVREQRRVYDTLGRLEQQLDAQGRATRHGYDPMGRPTSLIDPLDTESRSDYDPLGRLRQSIQDYHGIAAETQFDYDAQDRLLSVTDPNGLQTHYGYDGFGGLVSLSSPDTGVAEYRHDAAGNRTWQRDARGVETDYAYDALNRLIAIQYPDSTLNATFRYDEPDIVTGCPASHPVGRLTRMLDATGSTTYCYDRRGNVVEKRQHTGIAQLRLRYTYDRADRLVQLEYPSGQRVSLARDEVGRIRSAVLGSGGGLVADSISDQKPLVTQVDYLPFGPASSYTFGNGATLTRSYDQDFRLTAVASPALSLAFEHDAAGNIRASGAAPDAWEEGYDYDGLYRLTCILAGKGATVGYTYDATGNRTSHQRQGEPPVPYAYPPDSHRLASVGDTVRSYDETGNTLDGIAFQATLSYGDHGRLQAWSQARGQHARYAYNGRGERITKTDPSGFCINICPGTLFLYDEAGRLLGEYDLSGQPRQEHVWLDDTPVAVLQGKSIHYVHSDHLNTPRAITDEKGIVRWRWAFAGNAFGDQPADGDPQRGGKVFEYNLRFPGQYFDAESGLHYNYFRDYDPSTGRYVQSDPIGLKGGSNTYSYVAGSPLRFVDPKGLCRVEVRCDGYHCFIVTTEPNGQSDFFRGGPEGVPGGSSPAYSASSHASGSRSAGGLYGRIETEYGAYLPGTSDWNPNPLPTSVLIDNALPCACIKKQLADVLDRIQIASTPYNPINNNSNSTVSTALWAVGIVPGAPPSTAPGWGARLPLSNGSLADFSDSGACCAQ